MNEATKALATNAKLKISSGGFEGKNINTSSSIMKSKKYVEKYADSWILATGSNLPTEIVKIMTGFGYKKVVSMWELMSLYPAISPMIIADFGFDKAKIK
jgi:hypothetical protein